MAVLLTVELANKLIDHYEKCIAEVYKCSSFTQVHRVCKRFETRLGVCKCAFEVFGCNIYGCSYMRIVLKGRFFIGHPPKISVYSRDVIYRLQLRIDLLKQFKTENNGSTTDSGIGE